MTASTSVAAAARRLPRIDTRLAVGVLLIALSVLGGLRLVADANRTVGVLAATRDLPANHRITEADLRVARVHVGSGVLDTLVPARSRDAVRGRVVTFPVAAGALLARAATASKPAQGREITVPIVPEHALGGHVRVGDRVDLLGSFAKSTKQARTLTIAHDAVVVEVVRAEGLFGQREGQMSALTLSVSPDAAIFVAFAIRNADLDVVRTTGQRGAERQSFDGTQLP